MDKKWMSVSTIGEVKCEYQWIIKKIKYYRCYTYYPIESSKFFINYQNKKLHWSLRFHPNLTLSEDYLSIKLIYHESFYIPDSSITIEISILDDEDKIIYTNVGNFIGPVNCCNKNFSLSNYISRKDLFAAVNKYLIDDELRLCCKLKLMTSRTNTDNIETVGFKIPQPQLVDDFGKLIGEQKYGDIEIIAGGQVFKVYGGVLAARSPRLLATLEEMTESENKRVEIKDIGVKVFEEVLRFIYTDRILNTSDSNAVIELLNAADKYGLDRLKVICESILIKEVNFDNAKEYLSFAELYNAERLKNRISDFINLHNYYVTHAEKFESDWKSDLLRHPAFMIVSALVIGTITYKLLGKNCPTQPKISDIPIISDPIPAKFIEVSYFDYATLI